MKNNNLTRFLEYTLTADIYAADMPKHAPKELLPELESVYRKVLAKDKTVIVKLLNLIEKNPDVPQLKNYLSIYYFNNGDKKKAAEINNELLKEFPDYLFAKLNLANFCFINEETEKVLQILGTSLELCDLYPERKVFHCDEFFNYYEMAGLYYCKTGATGKAEDVLENLYEVADLMGIEKKFGNLEDQLMITRLENINFSDFIRTKKPVNRRNAPTLPQIKKTPAFHYPQISWLYDYAINEMPVEKVHELLSLEKEWLRIDLETAVLDAIKRYNYFSKQDTELVNADFCLHALYLLKEIEAEESLSVLLEFLRQPEDLLDFYTLDTLADNFWQVTYVIGKNQTDKLAAFLKEPLNSTFARSEVSAALAQIVLHDPERRIEIVDIYRDLLHFFISNRQDETIADNIVVNLMIDDIMDFKGKELLPEIKNIYAADMQDESMNGNLQDVIDNIEKLPTEEEKHVFFKNIENYFELAAEFTGFDDIDDFNWEDKEDNESEDFYTDWEEAEEDTTDYFYSGSKPYVRDIPKVGRNEPCPCGSGKKYKNCHGIDE